jgi:glycerol-3-phosphate dehydrogenase
MVLRGATDTPPALMSREEILSHLAKESWCDVLVVGGGIHGATFAHLAAFNGFRTVLLERGDYAEGTSSRSSKLAHGGIRYLEHFDFRQVYEGIRSREGLYRVAPHLVKAQEFVAPLGKAETFEKLKMWLGLTLYSAMARGSAPLPRWIGAVDAMRTPEFAGWSYTDGIMNDTRLVIERIIAARQEGAHCLNYAETELMLSHPQGVDVRWKETLPGASLEQRSIRAGIVVNCAGPWVSGAGGMTTRGLASKLRFSRGAHLLFKSRWQGPALVLPIREKGRKQKGRYYFVTPHPAGTLLGTTEREVYSAERDPLPSRDEIQELCAHVQEDLSLGALNSAAPHYCFAGIRALPVIEGGRTGDTAALSRGHRWEYSNGILSLLGGKYTTAAWTCWEGMKILLRYCERPGAVLSVGSRPLPGAAALKERLQEFASACASAGVSPELQAKAVSRLGGRVVKLLEYADGIEPLQQYALKGEVRLARDFEQAEGIEDIVRRRLDLEYEEGHGFGALPGLSEILRSYPGALSATIDEQVAQYRLRMDRVRERLVQDT